MFSLTASSLTELIMNHYCYQQRQLLIKVRLKLDRIQFTSNSDWLVPCISADMTPGILMDMVVYLHAQYRVSMCMWHAVFIYCSNGLYSHAIGPWNSLCTGRCTWLPCFHEHAWTVCWISVASTPPPPPHRKCDSGREGVDTFKDRRERGSLRWPRYVQ